MMIPTIGRTPIGNPIQYPNPISRRLPEPVGPPRSIDPRIGAGPMPVGPAPPIQRPPVMRPQPLGMFHKGGLVRKTGPYQLKKGEHVIAKGKRRMTSRAPQKMVSVAALGA